jgi:hypothetical protein
MSEDSQLRTQCIVVKDYRIAGTGMVEEVREEWGDKETSGNGGIKIVWTRKGETILPGL